LKSTLFTSILLKISVVLAVGSVCMTLAILLSLTTSIVSTQPMQAHAAPAVTKGLNGNPWGYNFTIRGGKKITKPAKQFCSYFHCVSDFWKATKGYVVECKNGKYSHSGGIHGVCSRDKGVKATLLQR
jgi:hypothetical protein